jgi:tetratricopeptide (TPR) repeat protein
MGSLYQQKAVGELVLEQNDGTRRLHWMHGELQHLRSDAVGEQFGNFLIRRGVLDMASLKELLADGEGSRVGDRVVQWGLLTATERDEQLHELLGSVLLHAMEHPILRLTWLPAAPGAGSIGEHQFHLSHRRLVWDTFQKAQIDRELIEMFRSEPDWRWQARPDLLESLSDLPLTPSLAYALTLLGTEPLGCNTIAALAGLPLEDAARLVATLWALGGISLVSGALPLVPRETPPPPVVIEAPPVLIPQPPLVPEDEIEPEPEFLMDPERDLEPLLLAQEDLIPPTPARPLPPPVAEALPPPPTPMMLPQLDEEALAPLERARRLLVKAKSYVMQDRTSEAIRALEQAIKLDGESPAAFEAWLLLGRLRISNPAWSTRAIEALQVASRLNPRSAEPWALMGDLYHRKGFRANAQGCIRRALELDPSVAVPEGWSRPEPVEPTARGGQSGLMGKLRGMFGREKE